MASVDDDGEYCVPAVAEAVEVAVLVQMDTSVAVVGWLSFADEPWLPFERQLPDVVQAGVVVVVLVVHNIQLQLLLAYWVAVVAFVVARLLERADLVWVVVQMLQEVVRTA